LYEEINPFFYGSMPGFNVSFTGQFPERISTSQGGEGGDF
jgi:hypothetical protein